MTAFPYNLCRVTKWLNPYTCYTQCRDAVCKHLVASIQGSVVSPAITRRDPRVYVEVSRSFSLWAPGHSHDTYSCGRTICTSKLLEGNTFILLIYMDAGSRLDIGTNHITLFTICKYAPITVREANPKLTI